MTHEVWAGEQVSIEMDGQLDLTDLYSAKVIVCPLTFALGDLVEVTAEVCAHTTTD